MESFNLFCILELLGGLAFFLYGMHIMSASLEKIAGGKLEKILKTMTSNPLKGLTLGVGVTAVIQSSSAVTVMLVGLVNSGLMKLSQAIGVIMGSNIGTTATAWILSLAGLEGDNPLIKFFKPDSLTPLLAFVGMLMFFVAKSNKNKSFGTVFLGFSILMTGMIFMSSSMSPLSNCPKFVNLLTLFDNPLFGVAIGTLLTAIIQSSSVSVGMLQALALKVNITCGAALPIIMGQNIGTCITAIISSVGVNSNAKKVAVTGTPTKVEKINLTETQRESIKNQFKIKNNLPIVIVFGGSQGAETINKCLTGIINEKLNKNYQIIWAVGQKNYEQVRSNIKQPYNACIVPYIYNMEEVMNLADLAVTRSGAMTITEVAKCGKPAIFIPYPYATENHQEYNAKVLANVGAAKIILDKELSKEKLNKTINEIIENKQTLAQMAQKAEQVSIKNVEDKIYKEIEKIIRNQIKL